MIKRLTLTALGLVLLLVLVLVGRTLAPRPAPPPAAAAVPPVPVDATAAVGRLAGAIRIQTVSEPEQPPDQAAMLAFRTYLEQSFPNVHATLTREVIADGALLYTWKGSDPALKPVIFLAHMDVVPVDPATAGQWTRPPFSGDVDGGYVWGRGSLDDKDNLMSIMEAAEILLDNGFQPKRTMYFAFGDDEENGGYRGARVIAQALASRGVSAEFLTDEGGAVVPGSMLGIASPVAIVGIAEKGIVSVRLSVSAPGGHSSVPPARTAIGRLATAVSRLEAHQMPARITPALAGTFDAIAPELPFPRRLVLANRWLFGPLIVNQMLLEPQTAASLRTTTAPTIFQSGIKDNVLPTDATAVVNFRILPGDTIDGVVQHIRDTIHDTGITVAPLTTPPGRNPSPISSITSAGYRALQQTFAQRFSGVRVVPNLLVAATDSSHYGAVTHDIYRFSPVAVPADALEAVHGINERIGIDSYVKAVQFMAQLMRNAQGD
ncbi:MAG: M20 family peptidase [Acidobacteriota bacterium]|nr:M20 family peptidase [Acidobacteriota bacterium]